MPDSSTIPADLNPPEGIARRAPDKPLWAQPAWLHIGSGAGFEWNRLDIILPGLPPPLQGLRIVHLSDTHLRARWRRAYDRLIDCLKHDPPDLLLFTGDLMDEKLDSRQALDVAGRFVSRLTARLGVFGITGNHDGDLIGPRMQAWNMHFMHRRFVRLEAPSAAIELIGLPSIRRTAFDPNWIASLPERQAGAPRIVLGHYPDQVRYIAPLHADLMLAGHTHGGQVCLPGGRALMSHDELPKRMAKGAHRFGETTLVVNRGFGMTKWPIRFCCPAEVVEIRLMQAE